MNDKKVYILEGHDGVDSWIVGVYATEELAVAEKLSRTDDPEFEGVFSIVERQVIDY